MSELRKSAVKTTTGVARRTGAGQACSRYAVPRAPDTVRHKTTTESSGRRWLMPNIAARSPVGYKLCARGTPSQLVHDSCRMRVPWCEQNAPAAPMPKRRQLTGLQNLARLWQTAPAPAGARIPTRSKSQRPTMACFRLQAGRARLTCRVATCEALKAQLQERARHSKVAMRCHPNLLVPRPARPCAFSSHSRLPKQRSSEVRQKLLLFLA